MRPKDEHAIDLLKAAYKSAEWQERRGRRFLLTFLDGAVAEAAGLTPAARDTPKGRTYGRAVDFLVYSGAVRISDIRDQGLSSSTFYEITPRGIEMLRKAGQIT